VRSAPFRAFFLGDVFVTVAERYFVLTFTWWLLSQTDGGAGRVALLLTLESAPVFFIGLLAGPLVDRWNKKSCLLASALLQCAVVAAVAVAFARGELSFPLLCAAGFAVGCTIPIFETAIGAALPKVVSGDELLAATSVQSSTLEFSNIIAAALSSALIATGGFGLAIWVNAGLYLLGAAALMRIDRERCAGAPGGESYLSELKAGLKFLLSRRALLAFVAVYTAKLFFFVPLLVAIPLVVKTVLDGGVGWVAVLEGVFSVASVVTALLLSLKQTHHGVFRRYAVFLAVLGAAMALLPRLHDVRAMAVAVAVMGACVAALLAVSSMVFQTAVPDELKGRFFGIVDTLQAGVTPLAYLTLGTLSGAGGVGKVLTANAIGLVVLAAIVLVLPRPAQKPGERLSA